MNKKAQKFSLFAQDSPPLLNLSDNRPHVDPSFKYLEHINAPFINEMLMPLQIKNTNGEYTYDNDGNSYAIKDGYLVKNDTNQLFPVDNKTFKRTNVTSLMNQYYAYDVDDGEEATVIKTSDNSFIIDYKGFTVYTRSLYSNGTILSSRLRVINGYAVFIVVYNDTINNKVFAFISNGGTFDTQEGILEFKRTVPRRSNSYTWSGNTSTITPEDIDPVINIAFLDGTHIGCSIINNYGLVLNSRYNGFATYIYDIETQTVKQLYKSVWPTTATNTEVITTNYDITFNRTQSTNRISEVHSCISSDNSTFYDYDDETKGSVVNFPSTYAPTSQGITVTIDGTTYTVYKYNKYVFTQTLTVNAASSVSGVVWSFSATNADGIIYTSTSDDSINKSVSYTVEHWPNSPYDSSTAWQTEWSYTVNNGTHSTEDVTVTESWTEQETLTGISAAAYPNVVCDNGRMYAFYGFEQNTSSWSYSISTGWKLIESGTLSSVNFTNNIYSVVALETVAINASANFIRSNSFVANQNLIQQTTRLCNNSARLPSTSASDNSTSSRYSEYSNSNSYTLRYLPGTTNKSDFNYYGDYATYTSSSGSSNDRMIFTVTGMRVPVKNGSNWNILYNTSLDGSSLIQGLSYSETEDSMGTLIAPWTSIDDDAYVIADGNYIIYRDKSNIWWKIEIVEETPEVTALLDNKYIFVNTTSYLNMYDSKSGRKLHYATDYNGRAMFGSTTQTFLAGYANSTVMEYIKYTATAINAAYQIQPKIAVSSLLLPVVARVRVDTDNVSTEHCKVSDDVEQGIDVYLSTITNTVAYYRYTIWPYVSESMTTKFDLYNTYYSISSLSYLSPNIFTRYINGAGNNDIAVETYDNYVLIYYNQQPYFLYTLNSQTGSVTASIANSSTNNPYESQAFFVLQGQFYAVVDEKLYSVIYSDGAISSMEAIVDVRGFKFIGNNPQIAFFWSPSLRAIYSFTGDAILQHIYDASKISSITGQYWYDETTQSIFISTDVGLLVFGPKNTYMLEDFTNVTNVQFSNDSVTHITNDGTTYNVVYYPEDGYESNNVKLATSFYGLGDSESTSIDRWNITLFDQSKKSEPSYVKVRVITITDCVVQSEEKEFKIKPDMYDRWSNSVLVMYNPKYIKGQGVRLEVETPLTIQSIIPHVMDNKSGTLTKHGV